MRKLVTGIVAALVFCSLPGLALADAAGSAVGVKPAADAGTQGKMRTLVVGADIFIGDVVDTGDQGQVQIVFADKTQLVVGPHSSLAIEDYLVRNDGSAGQLAVNMLAGSFRFATGDSAKNRYKIDTPTGTIGVRGTGFDVFVGDTGVTRILMYHGIVRFCSLTNKCKELSELCTFGEIDSADTAILGDARQTKGDLRRELKGQFIYSESQSPLLRQFWMAHAYDCLHNPPDVPFDDPVQHSHPQPPPLRKH